MALNPLTYTEIEAFVRLTHTALSAWEVDVICRLDTAARAAMDQKAVRPPKATDPPEAIAASNTAGVGALLRGLATKKAAQIAARSRAS